MIPKTTTDTTGFTLIEALVAMLVLTIGILSLMTLHSTLAQRNSNASHITIASTWATNQIEEIISTPYDELIDADGDGTDQDQDKDGQDTEGTDHTFGLDDLDNPDLTIESPDEKYTIYVNIAVDVPLEDSKTIRVHIQDNNGTMSNIIHFDYIRQQSI